MRPFWPALAGLFLAFAALAAPPAGTDPNSPTSQWFKSLLTPEGWSCCDQSDGRVTNVRHRNGGWEAWIDERFPGGEGVGWVPIPPHAILERTDNPMPGPVVFWRPGMGVRCFVRSWES